MATQADYERYGAWAVMFNPDANIDRHNRPRTVPMEVLSLGFSRTGTLSIQGALTILGYPTYHYSNIFANVKDADIWMEALNAKYKNEGTFDWEKGFDQVLGDYSAVTDTPGVIFWKELIEAYPDAKVILIERDEEKWVKSISLLFEGILNPVSTYILRWTDPFWFGRIVNCGRAWIEGFAGTTDLTQAKKNVAGAYRKHNAGIRAAVPQDNLLVYELGSGWEPLCKFLGKPIPDSKFPRMNEAATLEDSFGAVIAKAFKNSAFNLAVVIGVGAGVGSLVWRYF